MKAMVYIGILTNCFILGFSSEQMMQWLPWLFTRDAVDGDQVMALGSGRYAGIDLVTCFVFITKDAVLVSVYLLNDRILSLVVQIRNINQMCCISIDCWLLMIACSESD